MREVRIQRFSRLKFVMSPLNEFQVKPKVRTEVNQHVYLMLWLKKGLLTVYLLLDKIVVLINARLCE